MHQSWTFSIQLHIGLCEALGNEFYSSVLNDLDRRLGQRLHLDKPLGACERLDNGAAAVAAADIVVIRLDLNEIALLLEVGYDGLARLVAIHAVILSAVYYFRVLVDAKYLLEIMSEADLIVIGVMAGRHFDSARAEAKLNILVGNDGELSVPPAAGWRSCRQGAYSARHRGERQRRSRRAWSRDVWSR